MDYDEFIRVMIEFISWHPISIPLTKIPDPPLPIRLLHKAFERVKIDNNVLETVICSDHFVVVHKKTFLKAIGMPENPENFKVQEPNPQEFQLFLKEIGYKGEIKAKPFKKSAVTGLWTVLMHFLLQGLSSKHGDTDTLSKDWLYVVYNIFIRKANVVDITEVLWQDF